MVVLDFEEEEEEEKEEEKKEAILCKICTLEIEDLESGYEAKVLHDQCFAHNDCIEDGYKVLVQEKGMTMNQKTCTICKKNGKVELEILKKAMNIGDWRKLFNREKERKKNIIPCPGC